jgi:hypothetical protein
MYESVFVHEVSLVAAVGGLLASLALPRRGQSGSLLTVKN